MTRSEQLTALMELHNDAMSLALKARALERFLPVGTDLTGFTEAVTDAARDDLPWGLIRELESEASDEAMRQNNADRISYRG